MYIRKLVIFGFGQHENVTIDLKKGINVIYGLNEAGKTTIQQFILHILFGFPQKNAQQLRYEPKAGGKYGGQLHITDDEYGDCVIERVKGKAIGDVRVYFGDGTRGNEEALAKIVHGYNRQGFESIFSFSVHQLQQLEHMSEDDLSRVLLASGTTGIDQLTQLEKELDKKIGELFKKSGKNPVINKQIEDLRANGIALKEERKKIEEYEPAIIRLQQIASALGDIKSTEAKQLQEQQKLNTFRQIYPLLQKKEQLELDLLSILQKVFPTNGIHRYELYKDKKLEVQVTLSQAQQEKEAIQQQLQADFNEARYQQLKNLNDQDSEWREWRSQEKNLQNDIDILQQEKMAQYRLLGITDEQQQLALEQAEATLEQEDFFRQLVKQLEENEEQYRFGQRTAEQLQKELVVTEQKLDKLYDQQPSDYDLDRAAKWPAQLQRAAEARAILKQREKPSNNAKSAKLFSIAIAVMAILFGVSQSNWLIVAVGVIVAAAIWFIFGNNSALQNEEDPANKEALHRVIHEVESQQSEMEQLLTNIRQLDDRVVLLQEQYDEKNEQYKEVQQAISKFNMYTEQSQQQLQLFLNRFQISSSLQPKLLTELFRHVREIQQKSASIIMKESQLDILSTQMTKRIREASEACEMLCTKETLSTTIQSAYFQMTEQQHFVLTAQEKLLQLDITIVEKTNLHKSYTAEILNLFEEADAESAEDFYKANEQFELYKDRSQSLKQVEEQLAMFDEATITVRLNDIESQNLLVQITATLASLQEKKDALLREQAGLQSKTVGLLTDEKYGIHLQWFEQQKATLAEQAHEWAINKAISTAIQETMHNLKEKRLPAVLQRAERYFEQLTGGSYDTLAINHEGVFEAVAIDGMRYTIAELSQATKEQAYVALRFALADSLQQSAPFPIIMDDPFVHFDRLRIANMVQLVDSIQKKHQILYFTCHENMIDQWSESSVIHVSNLKSERGLTSI
ncbi:AAA family ATPase [Viridibacillus sp. YIM B01967]|uniref:AAA family ATPase n=1 Tax=Viridibacillus soli TaxID=2798301 RepID=A0ABS1H955_9BACL|nr:AAA family ATPase [Viridibacillus soli]MBK3495950.1 AAA family ATPase [Viridibacillus soli]